MEQILEFITTHWYLASIFIVLLVLFIGNEIHRGGISLSPQKLVSLINHEKAVVLDIRDKKDFSSGHIYSAINIPFVAINDRLVELEKNKQKPIVLVCKAGQHSGMAGAILRKAGFINVQRLAGGMMSWRGEKMPVVKD